MLWNAAGTLTGKQARTYAQQSPANSVNKNYVYDLTFSLSEVNLAAALGIVARGFNVAVVFGCERPSTWHGHTVIDGDEHDLRHLDPKGCFVGLTPKGLKAKRDHSGFVVREL